LAVNAQLEVVRIGLTARRGQIGLIRDSMPTDPNGNRAIDRDAGGKSGVWIWTKGPGGSKCSLAGLYFHVESTQEDKLARSVEVVLNPIEGPDVWIPHSPAGLLIEYRPPAQCLLVG
tara:strand:- start:5 stop:355 length:351 start_codon:yes stop_codon:yes gene_type:complete